MKFQRFLVVGLLYLLSTPYGANGMEVAAKKRPPLTTCYLSFDGVLIDRESHWNLTGERENIVIRTASKEFEDFSKRKALIAAFHFFYMQLPYNLFDVRYIERVLVGDMRPVSPRITIGDYQRRIILSERVIIVGEGYSKTISFPQWLCCNFKDETGHDQVKLTVISKILSKLEGKDREDYKERLIAFASEIMAPISSRADTQKRTVSLFTFNKALQELVQKNKLMPEVVEISGEDKNDKKNAKSNTSSFVLQQDEPSKKEEVISLPKNKKISFHNILTGLSCGLNLGLTAKYFLRDYLQENPKFVVPLLGISTVIGGLGGFAVPKFFTRRK